MIELLSPRYESRREAWGALDRIEEYCARHETGDGDRRVVWRNWGEGAPLVLLHGAHGYWAHWIRNIPLLAQTFSVWVPDIPGMGESMTPSPIDHTTIITPLIAGMQELGLSTIPVAGFSMGGVLATHLAAHAPHLVSDLIVVNPGGLGTPVGDFSLEPMRGLTAAQRREATRRNLASLMLHDPAKADALAIEIQHRGARNMKIDVGPLVMPDHLVSVLDKVRSRLSAIWGEFDAAHPDPARQERALRQHHNDVEFRIIPNAGHWSMFEQPDAFDRLLKELIGA